MRSKEEHFNKNFHSLPLDEEVKESFILISKLLNHAQDSVFAMKFNLNRLAALFGSN
jgi:hypothetical protein